MPVSLKVQPVLLATPALDAVEQCCLDVVTRLYILFVPSAAVPMAVAEHYYVTAHFVPPATVQLAAVFRCRHSVVHLLCSACWCAHCRDRTSQHTEGGRGPTRRIETSTLIANQRSNPQIHDDFAQGFTRSTCQKSVPTKLYIQVCSSLSVRPSVVSASSVRPFIVRPYRSHTTSQN